jgi:hypothetical protein
LPANRLFKCDQRSNEFPESMRLDFKHGQERNQLSEVNGQLLILDLRHRRPGADRFVGAFCVAHLLSNGFDEKVRSWHAGGKSMYSPIFAPMLESGLNDLRRNLPELIPPVNHHDSGSSM